MKLSALRVIVVSFFLSLINPLFCTAQELCVYITADGKMKQVNGMGAVPAQFQDTAKCFGSQPKQEFLADPQDVKLSGTVRRELMASSVGRIELRWPRKVELLFGRTPQRAMADAATTASRALKASSFPVDLQKLSLDWSVIFMDEDLPEEQIPTSLISNCHPAWMTAPANIYVVAQRVAAGCGGQRNPGTTVADSELAHVLLHEMGHVIEYQLLKEMQGGDRMRAEGFASWFEQYASEYSSVVKKGSVKDSYYAMARAAFSRSDSIQFQGSAEDYAQASMFFAAIVEKKGVGGLMDVYKVMYEDRITFFEAVKKRLLWDEKRLLQEVKKLLKL